jgi:hypothetical protein
MPFMVQWNLCIDESFFKKIKIKGKISIFFRGYGGESVSRHGIIKALLFCQIQGYALFFIALCLIIVGLVIRDILFSVICVVGIFIVQALIEAIVIFCLERITKRRMDDL